MFTKEKNSKIQLIIYSEHQKKSIFILCRQKKNKGNRMLCFRHLGWRGKKNFPHHPFVSFNCNTVFMSALLSHDDLRSLFKSCFFCLFFYPKSQKFKRWKHLKMFHVDIFLVSNASCELKPSRRGNISTWIFEMCPCDSSVCCIYSCL